MCAGGVGLHDRGPTSGAHEACADAGREEGEERRDPAPTRARPRGPWRPWGQRESEIQAAGLDDDGGVEPVDGSGGARARWRYLDSPDAGAERSG